MSKIKSYQCRFCKRTGNRHDIRKCIMTHIKPDKFHGINKPSNHKAKESVITENMLRYEID